MQEWLDEYTMLDQMIGFLLCNKGRDQPNAISEY